MLGIMFLAYVGCILNFCRCDVPSMLTAMMCHGGLHDAKVRNCSSLMALSICGSRLGTQVNLPMLLWLTLQNGLSPCRHTPHLGLLTVLEDPGLLDVDSDVGTKQEERCYEWKAYADGNVSISTQRSRVGGIGFYSRRWFDGWYKAQPWVDIAQSPSHEHDETFHLDCK
jgi:hypothetical protein